MTQPEELAAVPTSDLPTGGLDLSVLDKMVGGNPAKFRKFAMLFISSMTEVLVQVDAAVEGRDLAALAAMGHRAKSTALNVGATGLSGQCLQMEQAAKAGQQAQAFSLAQGLRPTFAAICAAIELKLGGDF